MCRGVLACSAKKNSVSSVLIRFVGDGVGGMMILP
jgi:hypothetical protein